MDKKSLANNTIIEGRFGLDDDFNNYITGKLCFNEETGVRLVLSDSFSDGIVETFREIQEVVERPIIKGYGNNGKYYELYNCFSMGGRINFGGLVQPSVNYGCEFLIEYQNHEIKDKEFRKISFQIDKLNQWCNTENCSEIKMHEPPFAFELQNKKYWEKEKDGLVYSIANGFSTTGENNVELNVSFSYYLGIEYLPEKINIENIKKHIEKALDFKTLLTLLINERAHINQIALVGGDNYDYSANIYCYAVEPVKECVIDAQKICGMVGLNALTNNLLEIFEKYIDSKELISGSVHSVLTLADIKKHRKIDVTNYVKQTATAIEGFMRNCRRVLIEESKKEFAEKMERILQNQTAEDKAWLMNKLQYSNQATFRKQVTKLFKEIKSKFPEFAKGVLDPKKQMDDIVDKFVNTRNFYTHYDIESKRAMLGTRTQIGLCDYINEILRLLLLVEIGIDIEIIVNANRHNQLLTSSKKYLLKSYSEENNG